MKRPISEQEINYKLSVGEAAKISGKATSTIRRWILEGFLKAIQDENGWYRIKHEDLMNTLSQVTHKQPTSESTIQNNYSQINENTAFIKSMQESLERERRINDEFRNQIKSLESEIFKLTHEIRAILTKNSPINSLSRWLQSKAI